MAPPRSVADATRFTATGPHAFTRAPPTAGTTNGETPQQRVARLRGAAKQAKLDQISTFDRIVDRGRIWADRAHKVVAIGLIGATVICGGITVFAFTDMVMFARRKKRAYFEEQKLLRESEKESQILAAVAAGADESTVRSEIEYADRLSHEVRKGKPVTARLKEWAFSGLTPPEKEAAVTAEATYVVVEKDGTAAATAVTTSPNPPASHAQRVAEGKEPAELRHDILNRPGADDLVKGGKAKGGSTGVLSSITGWWN